MNRSVVITGANRGIGLALTNHYLQQGWQVFAVCRRSSNQLNSSGAEVIDRTDVTDANHIALLAARLHETSIDLVINNAGILRNESLGSIDYDSLHQQFQVNAVAPLRVVEALQGNLASAAKLAMITSRMGSMADNSSGGRYGYRMSKAALNIAAISLAHDLKSKQIAVGIIHPGLVGTDMIGGRGDITPDEAAARIVDRIEELNLENSGTFWHSNGEVLPW